MDVPGTASWTDAVLYAAAGGAAAYLAYRVFLPKVRRTVQRQEKLAERTDEIGEAHRRQQHRSE